MRKITSTNEINDLSDTYYKVFNNTNPFDKIFCEQIEYKTLLFNTMGFHLTEKQFTVLKCVLRAFNCEKMYISVTECFDFPNKKRSFDKSCNNGMRITGDNNLLYKSEHWLVDIDIIYKDYLNLPIVLENAIYSTKGR